MSDLKLAYTIHEAAAAVGISVSQLRYRIANNELTVKYIGHKPVIQAEELADWLNSRPSEAPSK